MPGFDGTGPRGQGRMTGGGRGWRNCFYATGLPGWMRGMDELSVLKSRAEYLKNELDAVQARVQDMESK